MNRFPTSRRLSAVLAGTLLACSLLAVLPALAGAEIPADAKALAKLDDDWSKAAGTRDAKKVAAFYTEDAVVYPPNEPMAAGRAAAEKVWARYFAEPTYEVSWQTTAAGITGDLGFTAGTYEDSYQGADGKSVASKGKYLCVWKKQADGSWKAVHDMWNADH
jgi:uncharacterized protein (TIGR02246 family)